MTLSLDEIRAAMCFQVYGPSSQNSLVDAIPENWEIVRRLSNTGLAGGLPESGPGGLGAYVYKNTVENRVVIVYRGMDSLTHAITEGELDPYLESMKDALEGAFGISGGLPSLQVLSSIDLYAQVLADPEFSV